MKIRATLIILLILFLNQSIAQHYECSRKLEAQHLTNIDLRSLTGANGDTTINITYYKLDLIVTTHPDYLKGAVTVNTEVSYPSITSFYLSLSNHLTVDSIKSGNISLSFTHLNDKLEITLNRIYIQSEDLSVTIFYQGLPTATGFGSFVFGSNNSMPVIWSLSEPFGAKDWFPNKNVPSDKADSSDIWITCQDSLTAVSNGVLEEIISNANGTKTFKWKSRYPIANYLISIAITNYAVYVNYFRYSQTDSMPVTHYIYPQNLYSLKALLDKTITMLEIFSEKFGLYPFINEKYGHAEFGQLGGMEHQTISSMGVFNDYIIAHELAHQWFGDKITCKNWHHIWLNEGFATYSEAIYAEEVYGQEVFDGLISMKMLGAKKAVGSIFVQDVNSVYEIFNPFRSYAKGSIVLHMLRGVVGDSTFFQILKSYAEDSQLAYNVAVTSDFQNVAENVSGMNLDYFFQEWIYGENYPYYNIDWGYEHLYDNIYNLLVTLTQNVNSNPAFFTMPAEVEVSTEEGDTTIKIFNNAQEQSYNFEITGKPLYITFDPDNKILKDKKGDEIFTFVDYRLFQNYPNPFNPSTIIEYYIGKYDDVRIAVYDITGREIAVLINDKQKAGNYKIEFNAENLPSGVYLYKLQAGEFSKAKKMILLR